LATYNAQAVSFDADGNMIRGPLSGAMADFLFDSRNRLTSAGSTVYRYDAENQRIGVNQTQYVVNSQPALSQVLVRTKGNGEVTYYVYGLGLIGEASAGNYFSYHYDLRGSTIAITDETAQVIERFQYSPYGTLMYGDATTPFLFNGMYGVMSDANGLYYMRARFYSPEIRRFVNRDVLIGGVVSGQTLNRFAFGINNPVNYIDPEGRWVWWAVGIGAWIATEIILPSILQSDIPFDSGQLIPSSLPEIVPLVIAARTITNAVCRSLSETRGSLTNLGSNPFTHNVTNLDSYPATSAFSGVYDVKTGKWLAYPSGHTRLRGGAMPDNHVTRYQGHIEVNRALTDLLKTGSWTFLGRNRLGFVMIIDRAGKLKFRWNSQSINMFNYRFLGRTVPKKRRQPVHDSVKEATGRETYDDPSYGPNL